MNFRIDYQTMIPVLLSYGCPPYANDTTKAVSPLCRICGEPIHEHLDPTICKASFYMDRDTHPCPQCGGQLTKTFIDTEFSDSKIECGCGFLEF